MGSQPALSDLPEWAWPDRTCTVAPPSTMRQSKKHWKTPSETTRYVPSVVCLGGNIDPHIIQC